MDTSKYIQESKQVLNRITNMKDRVKALKTLDNHEDKWRAQKREIFIEILKNKNETVDEIHSELSYQYFKIKEQMTDSEIERYGNSLPDDLLDPDWCKNQREHIERLIASIDDT
jgi:proline dehydrogenase